jgi:hypothetical protein
MVTVLLLRPYHAVSMGRNIFDHASDVSPSQGTAGRPHIDGHLLLYTLSHVEPSGNAPVRPGYNELTLQLAMVACH